MKKTILILAMAAFAVGARSQQVFTFSMDGSGSTVGSGEIGRTEYKEIGAAELECMYKYTWLKDTTDVGAGLKEEVMVLQVGRGMSRFYSYQTMKTDSLLSAVSSVEEVLADLGRFKPGEPMNVYKNYSEGKLTFTDKVGAHSYRYEEDMNLQQWELHEDLKEIEGYTCRKATCSFRGRNYTAWYTWEIPVGDGPWKFSGLPGLIMEVSDDQGHYSYLLAGIRKVDQPINIADVNYHKTDRKKYLQTKEKFESDPIGSMGLSGVTIKVVNPDGSPNTEAAKPKELRYSYQERDYK